MTGSIGIALNDSAAHVEQFALNERQIKLRALVREMADNGWEEIAKRWDLTGNFDRHEVMTQIRDRGLAGLTIPREFGGSGAPYLDFIVAYEQMARVNYVAAFLFGSTCSGPIDFIVKLGTPAAKAQFLPKLASGEYLAAIAITEPQAGSDMGAIESRAEIRGDTVTVNGSKIYVGGGGNFDVYVAFVRMSDAPGVDGLGCVVIDGKAKGLRFEPSSRMMGSHAVPRSKIFFDDIEIPKENVLAGPGEFRNMIELFNGERIHNACLALGLAQGAYEDARAYARQRMQFGARLVDFQAIQWKLAEMKTLIEAARGLIYRAAAAKDAGRPLGTITSQAKYFAATYCPKVVDQALQIEGAHGYTEGSRVERAYRDIRLVPIAGGSVEMMLNYLGRMEAK